MMNLQPILHLYKKILRSKQKMKARNLQQRQQVIKTMTKVSNEKGYSVTN